MKAQDVYALKSTIEIVKCTINIIGWETVYWISLQ